MKIYTVTEFNREIKDTLSDITVTIQGEISSFHITQGRFVFFELKDDQSYISCFLMAFNLREKIEDGMEVKVTGSPSIFVKSGKFNFTVREIELVGAGALQKEFERLKKKLETEGLFDQARKRPLPRFPQNIGIITSEDAAAFTDVKRILEHRFCNLDIVLRPVPVQGKEAVRPIIAALEAFNTEKKADVIILTRGGGSLEDLQAFNHEQVVRAVFGSHIPVITGVGHERDTTLVDYVADARASTPTHAAELAVPHRDDVNYEIDQNIQHIYRSLENMIQEKDNRIQQAVSSLEHMLRDQIQSVQKVSAHFFLGAQVWSHNFEVFLHKIDAHTKNIRQGMDNMMEEEDKELVSHTSLLRSLHPLNVLKRGYSVTYHALSGKIIRNPADIHKGEKIKTRIHTGNIDSQVI